MAEGLALRGSVTRVPHGGALHEYIMVKLVHAWCATQLETGTKTGRAGAPGFNVRYNPSARAMQRCWPLEAKGLARSDSHLYTTVGLLDAIARLPGR